jgi:hypothetical protein
MPPDSLEFSQNPMLTKLSRVERLLATERQWCKGKLRDSDGRHCLVGAIEAADCWPEVARIILRAAREVSGKRYWRIESFNDDPQTTHADVLAVLRRARQNIVASMASESDRQPWHRKWLRALFSSSSCSEVAEQSHCRPLSSPRRRPGPTLPRREPSGNAGIGSSLFEHSGVTEAWVPAYAGMTRKTLTQPGTFPSSQAPKST